jgi:hypothetical protein
MDVLVLVRFKMQKEKIKKICDSLDVILKSLDLETPKWETFKSELEIFSEIIRVIMSQIIPYVMKIRSELIREDVTVIGTVKHYAEGAVKAVKAMTLPETEESKARLAVCHGCDKWTGTSCKVCGCFVNLKVKIPEEKCPEGKW